jgi:hypothetical protein
MSSPGTKFLSRSVALRAFLDRQWLFSMVAVALFALLWVTGARGQGTGFVPVPTQGADAAEARRDLRFFLPAA